MKMNRKIYNQKILVSLLLVSCISSGIVFANTRDWNFSAPADYSYDTDKIEVSSGLAKLKTKATIVADTDDTQEEFDSGTYEQTQWATDHVELTAAGKTAGSGTYTSRVLNAGYGTTWKKIFWAEAVPYGEELPDNKGIESVPGGADMTGNILLMHMNEANGTIVDSSGQGHNGTYSGALYSQTGKLNTAIGFDGSNDYIDITIDIPAIVTISVWAKSTASTLSDMLWCINNAGTGGPDLFFYNGKISLNTWDGASNPFCNIPSDVDQWHLYTTIIENGNTKLYIDDHLCGAATYKNPTKSSFAISSSNGYDWEGTIDEVAIYNRALSETEVRNHYKRGTMNLKFQVRSDSNTPPTGNFIGPDGTANTYFTDAGGESTTVPDAQYFQYRGYFSTDTPGYSPQLNSVSITYADVPYSLDNSTIQPSIGQKQLFSSVTAFSETATKPGGGEIRYVLSNDKGSTWKYWNGANWVTSSDTYTEANTSPMVDTNINSFPVGEANFLFKAFLHSDTGAVTPELDNVQIIYLNELPKIDTDVTYPTPSIRISVLDVNNDTTPITIGFDKAMADTDSWIDSGYITLKDEESNTIAFILSYNVATYTIYLLLDTEPLDYCKQYSVFLGRFVEGENGLPLGEDYTFVFTTMIDTTMQVVLGTSGATITIESGVLPVDAYVKIEQKAASAISGAYYDVQASPGLRPLQDIAYTIEATDANKQYIGNLVPGKTARIEFSYNDSDADGYIDGTLTEEDYLSIFRLDENVNRWTKIEDCNLNKLSDRITADVTSLSSFMIMGYVSVQGLVSAVTNYPNPFAAGKETTRIVYTLTRNSRVTIRIYNLVGDLIRSARYSSGEEGGKGTAAGYQNVVTWDGKNDVGLTVANGAYICEIYAVPADGSAACRSYRKIGIIK